MVILPPNPHNPCYTVSVSYRRKVTLSGEKNVRFQIPPPTPIYTINLFYLLLEA